MAMTGRLWASFIIFMLLVLPVHTVGRTAYASSAPQKYNPHSTTFNRAKLFDILRKGGFTNVLNRAVIMKKIGEIPVDGTCLQIFLYAYRHSTGSLAVHQLTLLILTSGSEYLGVYTLDEYPLRLNGNVLEFPGDAADGNTITFDSKTPPAKVYRNGYPRKLWKGARDQEYCANARSSVATRAHRASFRGYGRARPNGWAAPAAIAAARRG